MKLRLALVGIFLALCIAPAFADSLDFKNVGSISASGSNSGINLSSEITKVILNGTPVLTGPVGQIDLNTGSLAGSFLGGGTFTGGTFQISLDSVGAVLFASNFTGTWSQVSHDLYELVGTFSTTVNGLSLNGVTKQFFELEREDGKISFDEVHGKTCITPAAVPEPGTLTLLGTGLLGNGGMIRRKFAIA